MEKKRFFGSDPEFFIYATNKQTACGYIPDIIPPASLITDFGVKFTLSNNNKRILLEDTNYRWIEDGAALELNYKKPFNDTKEFYQVTNDAISNIRYLLSSVNRNFILSKEVLGHFDIEKYWKNRDKSFTDCVRFGCDPDVFPQLYLMTGFEKENCKIVDASKHEYRYAGGHIHIQNMSKNSDVYLNNLELAPIIFDFFIGTTNVLCNRDNRILEQEKARLKFYGRPGRIRIQQYSPRKNGIEYRPPSNQWLNSVYNINSILASVNIAASIIENDNASKFFYKFQDKINDMWTALTTHNKILSLNILSDSLAWALENHFITLSQLENMYGQF
jgi:hypothetical protein